MSVNIRSIKRMSLIIDVLNENLNRPIKTGLICKKVNDRMDQEWCKSQYEKDLFRLKMDFDLEYEKCHKGIFITQPFDFMEALKAYLI